MVIETVDPASPPSRKVFAAAAVPAHEFYAQTALISAGELCVCLARLIMEAVFIVGDGSHFCSAVPAPSVNAPMESSANSSGIRRSSNRLSTADV